MLRTFLSVVAFSFVVPTSIAATNLILNGSFEDYLKPPVSWGVPFQFDNDVAVGSGLIPAWQVINGNVDYFGGFWQAAQGTRSIDLAGSAFSMSSGGVSQTFATQPGQSYLVTFALSGNPFTAIGESFAPTKVLRVSAAGQFEDFSYNIATKNNSAADMKYEADEFRFVANSAVTTLQFFSNMAPRASGPVLDNVTVLAVPEASNVLFLLAGFGLLGLQAARRKAADAAAT